MSAADEAQHGMTCFLATAEVKLPKFNAHWTTVVGIKAHATGPRCDVSPDACAICASHKRAAS